MKMIQIPAVHSPNSTVEISKAFFCQETDNVNEYEIAEEIMEEGMEKEEEDVQNNKLDVTESSGMRYDLDETTIEEKKEKPKGYMVMVCWIGLAYTRIHKLCSSKA